MPAPHTFHEGTFASAALGREMLYTALLPADYAVETQRQYPVLYLLHGRNGNHTEWALLSRLPEYLSRFPMIVVCPEGNNGWYVNGANGERWEDSMVVDLPAHVEATYRTRSDRRGRAIAGLSMGGFGAFVLGMRHPERYCAISGLSGAYGIANWDDDAAPPAQRAVLGPLGSPTRHEYNVHRIAEQAVRTHGPDALPMLAFDCGTEDSPRLLESNRDLDATLTRLGVHHIYRPRPGGHDWKYWDREVPFTLQFVTTAMGITPSSA
jgi:S-formylglutathione hydrolase FrmB